MLHIAIVEDSPEDSQLLQGYLHQYEREHKIKFQIDCFNNGQSFICEYTPQYDIVLLDIEMPCLDGISTARQLREMDEAVCLIFVTNMAQFAINGYEVNAMDYLLKPLQYFYFATKLEKAIWNSGLRKGRFIGVETQGGLVRLSIAQIVYIESNKHYLTFYTTSGNYSSRSTIKEIQGQLPAEMFVRCHTSYLVNLDYVAHVEQNTIILDIGVSLPISRTYKKGFMDALTCYFGGIH